MKKGEEGRSLANKGETGLSYERMVVKWGGAVVEITVRAEAWRNTQRISDVNEETIGSHCVFYSRAWS